MENNFETICLTESKKEKECGVPGLSEMFLSTEVILCGFLLILVVLPCLLTSLNTSFIDTLIPLTYSGSIWALFFAE